MTYSDKLKNPKWQKKRLEILNRDNFECQFCYDKETMLCVHHISYNGQPWEQKNELLITLCENCHKTEEEYLKESTACAIKELKNNGFTAVSFSSLSKIFDTNRNWKENEPAFDVLKMVVDDDDLWGYVWDEFFKRLREKGV